MGMQESVGSGDGEQQIATVQPKRKHHKKKTGGGGSSSRNGSALSHAEQARVGSGLCFNHFIWGAKAKNGIKPCNWSGN
jgi:hypothetical protein